MAAPGASILSLDGLTPSDWERGFLRDADPFGFILFARNIDTPDQLRRLTGDLRDLSGRNVPILVDQEGGRVQRLRAPHWAEWIPPLEQAQGAHGLRALFLRSALIAAELRDVGIDANCAPCADIAGDLTHPFLRNRCLGLDAATVAANARAVADGTLAGGCLPVIKHIPGHGRATVDSHLHLPTVTAPYADLTASDFAPFKALNDLAMGMTAHIVFPDIDPDAPATCSPAMMRVIRDEIGFDGFLMTDDVSMQALGGSLAGRTRASLEAGCDAVLYCHGRKDELIEVAAAAGQMTAAALARADAALQARPAAPTIDIAAARAEFRALTGQQV